MSVSVVIPTYNRADMVAEAVKSVLAQTMDDFEIIVVDDGSENETHSILEKYGDRIKVIQGEHGGAGRARNLGIQCATNDLIAFLDSDDIWLPGNLEIQRTFMERRPDILFCFSNFEVEYRDGSVQPRYLSQWKREHATWEEAFGPGFLYSSVASLPEGLSDFKVYEGDLYRWQLTGFYVLTDTLVARRKEAGDALHFAEDLKTYEDLECFYRLSHRGKAGFLDVDTARQLDHPQSRLSQLANLDKIEARIILMRRIWGTDREFLSRYSDLYRYTLDDLLSRKAGLLLSQGKNRLARETLVEMHSPSPLLRMISQFPASFTIHGLNMYRILKNKIF